MFCKYKNYINLIKLKRMFEMMIEWTFWILVDELISLGLSELSFLFSFF